MGSRLGWALFLRFISAFIQKRSVCFVHHCEEKSSGKSAHENASQVFGRLHHGQKQPAPRIPMTTCTQMIFTIVIEGKMVA
jgi:hypothetical protein